MRVRGFVLYGGFTKIFVVPLRLLSSWSGDFNVGSFFGVRGTARGYTCFINEAFLLFSTRLSKEAR
jgi:hypothetical protein